MVAKKGVELDPCLWRRRLCATCSRRQDRPAAHACGGDQFATSETEISGA